jgi:putative lumazine-binding protein
MSKILRPIASVFLAVAVLAAAPAVNAQDVEKDKAAIIAAALDYAEGYYGGEPQRMARALSPFLSKRGLMSRPGVQPFLVQMNADTLIDASNGAKVAAPERHITTEVLHISGDAASARVFTVQFNDFLHLVRRNGQWQIVNVLWRPPTPSTPTPDDARAGVEKAVREYIGALFAGDAARFTATVHPIADLRSFAPAPQGRPRIVREQNPETLAAALASGQVKVPGKPEDVQVVVEGVDVNIAAARFTIGATLTYVHLAMTDGKWRVVNGLGYPPAPPPATR